MRVIKFRVWNKEEKSFLRKDRGCFCSSTYIYSLSSVLERKDDFDFLITEQFTGLLDKNGKEIYEGDIIEIKDHPNELVSFDQGAFVTSGGVSVYNMMIENEGDDSQENVVKIIGNIHQNPELLK